ncbi:nicotinamide riboside transporter PnuC [Nguyenibacter sp. L1]|nr:nicotinamide riboside transporter PnuC [Nguyenibacter sp. L1]WRH88965.1 nicotinamide riboside transporter PnuC [Nguyenibacter sp. L1]
MNIFSVNNILVHIPIGRAGYDLSWVEAIGTAFCLPCIWLASRERVENYAFGLVNVTCFAVIFFQIQLYASLLLQIFFFAANLYGWYAWTRPRENAATAPAVRWLAPARLALCACACAVAIALLSASIDTLFGAITRAAVALGAPRPARLAPDPFPVWDSTVLILQVAAMILMTRKYVESWILWSATYALGALLYYAQGVMVMALENIVLTAISVSGTREWILAARGPRRT